MAARRGAGFGGAFALTMANHDNSYKLLFSHQRMVRDLLTGFVKEAWVNELDLDSLEKANSGSYVSPPM